MLIATLTGGNDPDVMQRIQEDPELREMWVDPAVRSGVRAAPPTTDPIAKLLELVRAVTVGPALQQRIHEDPALRQFQSQPSVRQRIQSSGHH